MEDMYESRIAKLRRALPESGCDTLLVLVAENRRYLSGFTGEDTQFDESAGALLITDGALILATDSRFELQARAESPGFEIVCYADGLAKALPGMLERVGTRRLAFEQVRLTYQQYIDFGKTLADAGRNIDLQPTEGLVEQLRITKDADEIQSLRRALHLAESVFEACVPSLHPGVSEKELAWQMEKGMREAGAEALSFSTIVASGPNSALPHAIPGDRRLHRGEPVLFDWGARLDGYCSDISRTVIIGRPDRTFQDVFQTVMDAQRFAIDAIRPGVSSREVDRVAREYIDRKGYGGQFGHGLGHGTGLAIHEAPRLSPHREITLAPGMVTTVEPGIYLPDWGGIRLENMVVVTEDGAEVLNRHDLTNYVVEAD